MRFIECFDKLIENRTESTKDEFAKEQWYLELQDKLIALQSRPQNEIKSILSECNEINNEIESQTVIRIYRRAFSDGIEAAGLLTPILTPK
jgi:hypothetical protein